MKLRSKIVEIEAVEYSGLLEGKIPTDIVDFVGTDVLTGGSEGPHHLSLLLDGTLRVWNELEQQWITCPVGHYILKGLKGEFYPCEPEALFMKYDIIDG